MKIPDKTKKILKKLGIAGFLFFLIKGIIWLVAGAFIIEWLRDLF
jgi:hypothetical protein